MLSININKMAFLYFQVASKSLNETCGTDLKVQFLSNAPTAVIKKNKNKNDKVRSIVLKR